MKKIVKGNDFTLRIPVVKIVEGQKSPFPLPGCTDIHVRVCNQFKRIELPYEIGVASDNVLMARVKGDQMPMGNYSLEVRGKLHGIDWRSNEYPQFAIVNNNADGDTEFGETDEGDNSVEMDTALVILPPTVELTNLIESATETIVSGRQAIADIKEANAVMAESEDKRVEAEQGRVDAEDIRVENEKKRVAAEQERNTAETKRETDTDEAIKKCEQAVVDAQVAVTYDPDGYGIVITTGKEATNV